MFFNTPEKKRLLENFLSLSVLQIANYILPLITVPYLVRVLGFEYFGLISFSIIFIGYFILLTNYGFELTATREISINQSDIDKLSEIFSSVMIIRTLLMVISFFVLTAVVFSFEKFSKDWLIYYLSFGIVIGNVLFPVWFFQGVENMKYITILNFISKLIFVVLIFIFVKKAEDYYLVPFLTSLGSIISGLIALIVIRRKFGIRFKIQKFKTIKKYLIDGWSIFLSRIYVNIYTTTNVFILGLLTNNVQVGYYSVIEKIVLAIGNMLTPINQALFPYLSKLYKKDINIFFKKVATLSKLFFLISIGVYVVSFLFKDFLIYIITGSYNKEISFLLGIFLLRIITYQLAPLFSNVLIIMKKNKDYMKVMNLTVLLNFLVVPPSIYLWELQGLVISFISVIFIHVLLLLKKYKAVGS
jgi:PST family polysaccharide transporter